MDGSAYSRALGRRISDRLGIRSQHYAVHLHAFLGITVLDEAGSSALRECDA